MYIEAADDEQEGGALLGDPPVLQDNLDAHRPQQQILIGLIPLLDIKIEPQARVLVNIENIPIRRSPQSPKPRKPNPTLLHNDRPKLKARLVLRRQGDRLEMPEIDFDDGLGEGGQVEEGELQGQLWRVFYCVGVRFDAGLVYGVYCQAVQAVE